MPDTHQTRLHRLGAGFASVALAALAIFAFLLVLLGVFARPGHDGVSRVGGHPMLTVLSGSMTGVFRPGDLLIDDPVSPSQANRLVAGDIITFRASSSSAQLITHKIIAVKHQANGNVGYQTKGVANNAPDPELVQPNQVVGTYRLHIPLAGYLLQAVQKKTIFFLLIAIPLLYLGAAEILKRRRETQPDESKAEATQLAQLSVEASAPEREAESEELVEPTLTPTASPAPEPVLAPISRQPGSTTPDFAPAAAAALYAHLSETARRSSQVESSSVPARLDVAFELFRDALDGSYDAAVGHDFTGEGGDVTEETGEPLGQRAGW